jgi:hypothetical protein
MKLKRMDWMFQTLNKVLANHFHFLFLKMSLDQVEIVEEADGLLDEDEQEQVIKNFENKSKFQSKLYRAIFATFGSILMFVYCWFFYLGETFGEQVNVYACRLVHFLTAIGFLVNIYRIVYSKRHVDQEEERISLYFCLICSSFEFLQFGYPLYLNLGGIRPFGIFNYNLILFPFLPIVFTLLSEYSLHLMVTMDFDILHLNEYKYKYKKL